MIHKRNCTPSKSEMVDDQMPSSHSDQDLSWHALLVLNLDAVLYIYMLSDIYVSF